MQLISRSPLLLFVFALTLAIACPARAQQFPSKPVHVVVPFPPGGGIDALARAIAVELSTRWGQQVIVDNKAGAGSVIGATAVAHAPQDGYTLLATINQTLTSNRFLYKSLPYDPDGGFSPIALLASSDQFVIANPALDAKNLKDLVGLAKRRPGSIAYGSFGQGSQSHLLFEMFKAAEKLDMTHVPYKGIAPALTAVVANEVQLTTASAAVAGPLLKAGKVKALAIAADRRSSEFPSIPTTAELGFPSLRAPIWFALLAPAGTPAPVVNRISEEVRRILREPAFVERNITARGLTLIAGDPAELLQAIRDDVTATAEMIKTAGVQPE